MADQELPHDASGRGDPDGAVAALRVRLDALEHENAVLRSALDGTSPSTSAPRPRRHPGRAAAVVVLVVVAGLLAPVAVVAGWARGIVTDGDRYLATVAPLVEEPQIQQAVSNRVTTAIVQAIDLDQLAADATQAVAGLGLPAQLSTAVQSLQGPLVTAVTDFIRSAVDRVVTSDAFDTAWREANREVHQQVVDVLRGDPDALASIDPQGTLTVDLGPVLDSVKQSLADSGFTIVERLPSVDVSLPVARSADLVRLKSAYAALDVLGTWLPWVVLALLAASVMLSRHRSRAVVVAGLTLAGAMLLLGLAIAVGRSVYASSLPPSVLRPDAAVVVYDQVVSLLRIALRSVFVLGVVAAAVAFAAGPSTAAVALRRSWTRLVAGVRSSGERRGVTSGPVGVWLDEQRVLVRTVIGVGAGLALVLGSPLTPSYVLWVAVVAVVLLALATLLARPAPAPPT